MNPSLPTKAKILTTVVILTNVLGNLALSVGIKGAGLANAPMVLSTAKKLFSPMVLLGISLLIIWLLSRMTLMGWADLSYILPITSIGYVLSALAGKYVLAENISGRRWAGTALIFAGALLVSLTAPKTRVSSS